MKRISQKARIALQKRRARSTQVLSICNICAKSVTLVVVLAFVFQTLTYAGGDERMALLRQLSGVEAPVKEPVPTGSTAAKRAAIINQLEKLLAEKITFAEVEVLDFSDLKAQEITLKAGGNTNMAAAEQQMREAIKEKGYVVEIYDSSVAKSYNETIVTESAANCSSDSSLVVFGTCKPGEGWVGGKINCRFWKKMPSQIAKHERLSKSKKFLFFTFKHGRFPGSRAVAEALKLFYEYWPSAPTISSGNGCATKSLFVNFRAVFDMYNNGGAEYNIALDSLNSALHQIYNRSGGGSRNGTGSNSAGSNSNSGSSGSEGSGNNGSHTGR